MRLQNCARVFKAWGSLHRQQVRPSRNPCVQSLRISGLDDRKSAAAHSVPSTDQLYVRRRHSACFQEAAHGGVKRVWLLSMPVRLGTPFAVIANQSAPRPLPLAAIGHMLRQSAERFSMIRKSWTAKGKLSLVWIAGRRLSAAGAVFLCAAAQALSASVYTLYDLGTGGMTSSSSSGINSSGHPGWRRRCLFIITSGAGWRR